MSISTIEQANAAPEPNDIVEAIDALYSQQERTRSDAVRRLAAYGEPAVAPLMEILIDPTNPASLAQRRRLKQSRRNLTFVRHTARKEAARALRMIVPSGVAALQQALENRNGPVQLAALSSLSESGETLTAETLRELLHKTFEIMRRLQRQHRLKLLACAAAYFVAFWFLVWAKTGKSDPFNLLWLSPFFQTACILSYRGGSTVLERRKILAALGDTQDTRMVGAFAGCLSDKDKEVRSVARKALLKILPNVRPADRQYISPAEMDALIRKLILGSQGDIPLMLAILKAFEQIGDERALPAISELVEPDNNASDEIQSAAKDCMEYLWIRAQEAEQARTLLRASAAWEDRAPETLLRPAQGVAPVDASQLLRPGIEG